MGVSSFDFGGTNTHARLDSDFSTYEVGTCDARWSHVAFPAASMTATSHYVRFDGLFGRCGQASLKATDGVTVATRLVLSSLCTCSDSIDIFFITTLSVCRLQPEDLASPLNLWHLLKSSKQLCKENAAAQSQWPKRVAFLFTGRL